jgi:hypothetical protein
MIEDVKMYRHWYKFTNWTINKMDVLPKRKRFTISDRIENTTLEILEDTVYTIYQKDRLQVLNAINIKLTVLMTMWRICFDNKWISIKNYEFISEQINEFGRIVGGWIKNEKNRKPV